MITYQPTVHRYWEELEIDFEYTIQSRLNVLIINNLKIFNNIKIIP